MPADTAAICGGSSQEAARRQRRHVVASILAVATVINGILAWLRGLGAVAVWTGYQDGFGFC